jgi:hypothetical protein
VKRHLLGLAACVGLLVGAAGKNVWGQGPGNLVARPETKTEDLHQLLVGLGYDVAAKIDDDGKRYEYVTIQRDGWTFHVTVKLHPEQNKVWLIARLADLPALNQVPAERLARLLEENDNMASYFVLTKDGKTLYFKRYFDNRDLSPVKVREQMDVFLSQIKETQGLWDVSKWNAPARTPPAPAPAPSRLPAPAFAAPVPGWKTFAPAGGGFRVSMPDNPTRRTTTIGEGALSREMTIFEAHKGMAAYRVSYVEVPREIIAAATVKELLDEAVRGADAKVIKSRDFTLAGNPGREVTLEGPGGTIVMTQFILARNRLYGLATTGLDASLYFSSFELTR